MSAYNMPETAVTTFDCMGKTVFQRNPLFVGLVDQRSIPPAVSSTPAPAPNASAMQQALLSSVTVRYAQDRVTQNPLPTARSPLSFLRASR